MKSMTRSTKSRANRTRPGIPRPGGGITAGLAAGALALLATACGAGPAASGIAVPSGAEPVPQDVHTLPDHKLPPRTLGTSCVPRGSLAPTGPLPAPGHMPAGSTMAAIAQRGYLRVGVDQTIDLSSYRNPLTGRLEGFDISVAERIAQAIFGKPANGDPDEHIQFKAITSAQRIPVIQNNIVADSMTTGQTELADAIQDGLAARRAGDLETATARLGRAVALAHAAGEEETARLLAGVVDVVDPVTGTVQLKAKVRDVDEMTLDVESTKTVRVKR
jgi:hypothetical protein